MPHRLFAAALTLISIFTAACRPDSPTDDEHLRPLDSEAMAEALSAAGRRPSPLERFRSLSAALDRIDASNLDAARETVERELWWWFGDVETELYLEAWTRVDPPAALAFAALWPDAARRPKAMGAVFQAWALADPEQAASEAERYSRKYPALEGLFVENLLKGWAESGRPGLLAFAAKGTDAFHPAAAIQIVGTQTRRLGVPGVLEWADEALAEDIPPVLRMNLCRRVAGLAGRLDPPAVAAWLAHHTDQPYADEAPRLLTERWVAIDPEAAIDWATANYPDIAQTKLLRSGYSKWLARDFDAASEWIRATPAVARYDSAKSSLAVAIPPKRAEEAIQWASAVIDDEVRRSTLQRVASSWYQHDPVAAESWLQQSELDEAARTIVRRAPERRRLRPLDP
jgi:hypothetical protein